MVTAHAKMSLCMYFITKPEHLSIQLSVLSFEVVSALIVGLIREGYMASSTSSCAQTTFRTQR